MSKTSPADQTYQQAHDGEDRGPTIVKTAIALAAIIGTVVTLRLAVRYKARFPYGWDDFFCGCGLLFFFCMCAINIVSVHFGLGKHIWATDPTKGYKIIQAGYFLAIDYAITNFCIKMALLLTYLRFFGRTSRIFRYATWTVMLYVFAWCLSLVITAAVQCRPSSYFWRQFDISLNPPAVGHCPIENNPLAVSSSALNTVADFAILILPLPMLWRLQMPLLRKLGLLSIFLVGIFGCVAGIVRLTTTLDSITAGTDSTWSAAPVYIWTMIEAAIQLFCGCVPIVWPVVVSMGKKIRSSMGNGSGSSNRAPLPVDRPNRRSKINGSDGSNTEMYSSGFGPGSTGYASNISHEGNSNNMAAITDDHIVKHVDYSVHVLNQTRR